MFKITQKLSKRPETYQMFSESLNIDVSKLQIAPVCDIKVMLFQENSIKVLKVRIDTFAVEKGYSLRYLIHFDPFLIFVLILWYSDF